jgi:colanic acid biosynthesis glycosyl transferase WcaI
MRLLVITNLFHPDRGGGASVFSDLCFSLQERGWDVTVFTTYPYYPEWHRKTNASPWRISQEEIHGVHVWRHGMYVPANPSKLVPRILLELSFGVGLLRSLFRIEKFDAVMVYCPMLSAVLFATLRKLLLGDPLWLNVQDIPADAAAASGISQSGLFNRLADWGQRILFNRADTWSTISPVMVNRLAGIRDRNQPLHLCPNWLNGSLADCIAALPSKVGRAPASPPRFLYAGNIGKKQGLLEFCRALQATALKFKFQIHGNGGEADGVRRWVETTLDPRFLFGEFLDEPGFARALHETDVFVITERPGSGASFIPSKLIPCIATATPVLAVCDRSGPLGMEMTSARLGKVVEWNETLQLTELLSDFLEDAALFRQRQADCLTHSRNYHRDTAVPRFDQLLRELADQRASTS